MAGGAHVANHPGGRMARRDRLASTQRPAPVPARTMQATWEGARRQRFLLLWWPALVAHAGAAAIALTPRQRTHGHSGR